MQYILKKKNEWHSKLFAENMHSAKKKIVKQGGGYTLNGMRSKTYLKSR